MENGIDICAKKLHENEVLKYIELRHTFKSTFANDNNIIYLINKAWLCEWKRKTNYHSIHPSRHKHDPPLCKYNNNVKSDIPSIDNSMLIRKLNPNSLHLQNEPNPIVTSMYHMNQSKYISEEIWKMFVTKYGGGPPIKCIYYDNDIQSHFIEIRLLILPNNTTDYIINDTEQYSLYMNKCLSFEQMSTYIYDIIKEHELITPLTKDNIQLWLYENVREILSHMETSLSLNGGVVNLSKYFNYRIYHMIPNMKTVPLFRKVENEMIVVLVEQKPFTIKDSSNITKSMYGKCNHCNNNKLLVYQYKNEVSYYFCSKKCYDNYIKANCVTNLVGIANIGNTCFMNTALQCLSHCNQLTNYFLTQNFSNNIINNNYSLVKGFQWLLKKLFYDKESTVKPNHFKNVFMRYNKDFFSDYEQQDAHEFLMCLLNALHDELKRECDITEGINGSNEWNDFIWKNNSKIVELFYGMFKSTVKCPNDKCTNENVIYEPFLSLSLPLKMSGFVVKVSFYFLDICKDVIDLYFNAEEDEIYFTLAQEIANMLNVEKSSFSLVSSYKNSETISICNDNDYVINRQKEIPLFIYAIENYPPNDVSLMLAKLIEIQFTFQHIGKQTLNRYLIVDINMTINQLYMLIEKLFHNVITPSVTYYNAFQFDIALIKSTQDTIELSINDENVIAYYLSTFNLLNNDVSFIINFTNDTLPPILFTHLNKSHIIPFHTVDLCERHILSHLSESLELGDLIRNFVSEETLQINDQWLCSKCQEHQSAYKQITITKHPSVLIIQLKRFTKYNKLTNLVKFPIKNLKIAQHTYDLFAVANHFGNISSGHYTAYAFRSNIGKWYEFNDTKVTEVNEKELISNAAYVLFYSQSSL